MRSTTLFGQAWQINWNNKYLWWFGLLAGLKFGDSSNAALNIADGGAWLIQNLTEIITGKGTLRLLTVIVGLFFWVAGNWARAAMVIEVRKASKPHNFKMEYAERLKVAWSKLPKIIGMQLFIWSPFIAVFIMIQFSFFLGFAVLFAIFWASLPLAIVEALTFRVIVIHDMPILQALRVGINALKLNWRNIIEICFSLGVIAVISSLLIGLAMAPILPSILENMQAVAAACENVATNQDEWLACMTQAQQNPDLIFPLVTASIISAILGSVFVTYHQLSSHWHMDTIR